MNQFKKYDILVAVKRIVMKEIIIRALWAAICAWCTVWGLGALNDLYGILDNNFCGYIINTITSWGFSPKKILFFALFGVYAFTSLGKRIGNWLFILIVIAIAVVIIVILGGICLMGLNWMAGTL